MNKLLFLIAFVCCFNIANIAKGQSDSITMKVKLIAIDSFNNIVYPNGIWEKRNYLLLLEPTSLNEYSKSFDTTVDCKRRFVADYSSLNASNLKEGMIYEIKFIIQKPDYSERKLQEMQESLTKPTDCAHLVLYPRIDRRYYIFDLKKTKISRR